MTNSTENDEGNNRYIKGNALVGRNYVNLDKVISSDHYWVATALAKRLNDKSNYVGAGVYFKNITKAELDSILDKAVLIPLLPNFEPMKNKLLSQLTLLGVLLARSEGIIDFDNDESLFYCQKVMLYAYITSKHREKEGLAYFENFSMESADDKPVYQPFPKSNEKEKGQQGE